MDGKISVLSRLILTTLLFILSGNAFSDKDYSPGDVIYISLDESESSMDFYYKGNIVTKILKKNKPHLLFGIPYYTKKGENQFLFKSKEITKKLTFYIKKKKYPIQRIEIKKFKTKTKDEYKRIANERSQIIQAKKQIYDTFPDYMFIIPAQGTTSGTY